MVRETRFIIAVRRDTDHHQNCKNEAKKRSRGQSKKQAEERERFSQRIEEKEQRSRSGLAADGQRPTPLQAEYLREIVRL